MLVGHVLQKRDLGGHSKYASSKRTEQFGLSEGEGPGARHAAYDGMKPPPVCPTVLHLPAHHSDGEDAFSSKRGQGEAKSGR
jgi:hypothetical protein